MLSKNILFKNFSKNYKNEKINKIFNRLKKDFLNNKPNMLDSLSKNYKYNYNKKLIHKYKKFKNFNLIGVGGSILGAKTIYKFLNYKIKKKFYFIDNLQTSINLKKKKC
tara:strand:+ start:2071 stop:2397 length:327 start_codon:yes stop_codon:yes gene_type:complete